MNSHKFFDYLKNYDTYKLYPNDQIELNEKISDASYKNLCISSSNDLIGCNENLLNLIINAIKIRSDLYGKDFILAIKVKNMTFHTIFNKWTEGNFYFLYFKGGLSFGVISTQSVNKQIKHGHAADILSDLRKFFKENKKYVSHLINPDGDYMCNMEIDDVLIDENFEYTLSQFRSNSFWIFYDFKYIRHIPGSENLYLQPSQFNDEDIYDHVEIMESPIKGDIDMIRKVFPKVKTFYKIVFPKPYIEKVQPVNN